jgi:acyl-CoA thioesterase-1
MAWALAPVLALVLAMALSGCGRKKAAADCRLPPDAKILAIGDSLTRGHGADGQGYAEQLQALLAREPARAGVRVVNAGIDGEQSAGLLARIDDELAQHQPALVLITTGGNDILRRVSPDDTRRHLRAVVERVNAAGAHAIVFAVPRLDFAAVAGLASDHPLYAEAAGEAKLQLLPGVVGRVLSQPETKSDRIHPNAAGYGEMADAAWKAVQACR